MQAISLGQFRYDLSWLEMADLYKNNSLEILDIPRFATSHAEFQLRMAVTKHNPLQVLSAGDDVDLVPDGLKGFAVLEMDTDDLRWSAYESENGEIRFVLDWA